MTTFEMWREREGALRTAVSVSDERPGASGSPAREAGRRGWHTTRSSVLLYTIGHSERHRLHPLARRGRGGALVYPKPLAEQTRLFET
jgi:hypothetical protein